MKNKVTSNIFSGSDAFLESAALSVSKRIIEECIIEAYEEYVDAINKKQSNPNDLHGYKKEDFKSRIVCILLCHYLLDYIEKDFSNLTEDEFKVAMMGNVTKHKKLNQKRWKNFFGITSDALSRNKNVISLGFLFHKSRVKNFNEAEINISQNIQNVFSKYFGNIETT